MFPHWQFRGPSRQRGAIGLMAALTLALALGFTVLVIDSGRLYLEQRKLQRVADTAALEAVTRNGNCLPGLSASTYATQSAVRNGFTVNADGTLAISCGTLQTGADNRRAFTADATKSSAIRVIASHTVPTSVAAGIGALLSGAPASLTTRLSATAVAASPLPPLAQLSIRSTLADVNLLNPLFSSLLGSSVNLTLASWNALAGANINLLSYMDQLAIDLGVTAGDYNALLQADATVGKLIKAAAKVAQLNGSTADVVTGLNSLVTAAVSPVTLHLGDLLKLQTGGSSAGLEADLNALQLVQAFVQLGNSKNALAATLPVNLLGLGLGATASIKVIEPPQFSVVGNPALAKLDPLGANRIYVRTAQVRVLVTLDLSLVTNVIGLVTGTLSVVTGLLGLDLQVLPSPNLDVSLEAGGGNSYVTDYSCVSDTNTSLVASATTSLATLRVGKLNSNWASSSAPLTVTPITLLDIGQKPCGSCARIPFAGGGADLMINSPALQTTASHTFINPAKVGMPPVSPYTLTASNAIAGLSQAVNGIQLTVHAPTFNPGALLQVVFNTLVGLVNGVLTLLVNTLSGILSPLLDNLLNNVLLTLGIDVGKIQVDANLTCGQKGKAYLVI
ncbi:pilus assembly protein TadG-related protein [Pseudomonas sp. 14P_8.1_Bac3]|uniref:pilus assembly protein TadG-related protein n=1 Tax=Pseudomonas sp. 14P_8.1_Bac3 TaxID=2971621 RepID=UPI0021C5C3E8|nr:pilus assembly protein TadG-related protein [Pseudomonas sp. 14P_8.1_Bac3]MCU1763859.1 pilus assembly protein TadG-related protein [Pseudomonas sp. 14P_8.1_Bac3]